MLVSSRYLPCLLLMLLVRRLLEKKDRKPLRDGDSRASCDDGVSNAQSASCSGGPCRCGSAGNAFLFLQSISANATGSGCVTGVILLQRRDSGFMLGNRSGAAKPVITR
jgi:hypothetical protein